MTVKALGPLKEMTTDAEIEAIKTESRSRFLQNYDLA